MSAVADCKICGVLHCVCRTCEKRRCGSNSWATRCDCAKLVVHDRTALNVCDSLDEDNGKEPDRW